MIFPHLIILPTAVILLAVVSALGFVMYRRGKARYVKKHSYDSYDGFGWNTLGILGACFGAAALVGNIVALIPFDSKYHVFYDRAGVIESIESAISAGNKTVYNSFVVTLDGDETLYSSADNRVSSYEPGDEIALVCTLEWKIAGGDKFHCSVKEG